MATTVGQHSVAAFTSPVNGTTPIDANTVRGNDNTVRVAYVDHDADPGIHVQSSTLAARPTAGTAGRKWITSDYPQKLWYDDGTDWHEVGGDAITIYCKATETIAKGDIVKVTGYNTGQDVPEIAKVASASDVAFGIAESAIASGSLGYVVNTGIIQGVATNSFSLGNILYPNTSGGLTATKPTSGTYQTVAYVLRAHASAGVLYVEFSAPRIVEASANTASTVVQRDASGNFSAGTITAGALTSTGLVTFASLKGTGATTVTNILDEDNMASDSATALATQQSIKAYVDTKVATVDTLAEVLANGNTTGANNIIVSSGQKITTNTIDETTSGSGVTIDSVLLKDDVVNATDIETGTVSANDGTLAITIANSTGALTLASALADSNLATISTAGKVANSATTATSANTASAIVARDASGNFTAGTITAALTGNASTATTLQTARNINGVSFNGSADITVTADAGTLTGNTLASGVTASSLTSVGTLTSLTVSGDLTVDTSTLKVDSTGNNVGIGLTSPGARLHVRAQTNGNMMFQNSVYVAGGVLLNTVNDASSASVPLDIQASTIQFAISGAEKMRLDSSGNLAVDTNTLYVDATNNRVGVGTASPGFTLDIEKASGSGRQDIIRVLAGPNATNNGASLTLGSTQTRAAYITGLQTASTSGALVFGVESSGAYSEVGRFDASGNLGVGTTSPTLTVDAERAANQGLSGTGYRVARFTSTSAAVADKPGIILGFDTAGAGVLGAATESAGQPLAFWTYDGSQWAERARITKTGYFKASNDGTYFGSTGSYHELRQTSGVNAILVSSNTQSSPYGFEIKFTGASPDNNTNYFLKCEDSTANRTFIYSDGDVWTSDAGTLTSDATLKRDITDATPKLADVMRLKVRNFYWTEDYHPEKQDKKLIGFIAQEFEEVFPGLVSEHAVRGGKPIFEDRPVLDEDGEPVLDEDGMPKVEQVQVGETPKDMRKGLKEGKLIPILVKALQEAVERIEALEARLEALEA